MLPPAASAKVNKIWEELEHYKKKLGLLGKKVDSIEFYNEKIKG